MLDISLAAREAYFAELDSINTGAVFSCRSFPPSVLAGLGLKPIRLPLSIEESSGGSVREDICPLVDQLLKGIRKLKPVLVTGMHTCDMTRRFFQEASRYTAVPVHQLQLPATSGALSADFFAGEIERVCRDIVLGGHAEEYSWEIAEKWYRDAIRGLMYIRSIMYSVPPVALQYFYHFFRVMEPDRAISLIENLVNSHSSYSGNFRLLLTGSPSIPGDDSVAELVEDACGYLIPVNCTGTGMFPVEIPENWSPGSIARMHFHSQKCIRCRPNMKTFQYISEMTELCSAGGVILKTLTFCDLWYTEKVRIRQNIPVPVLVVDSNLSQGERERMSMRVETFIQSVEEL